MHSADHFKLNKNTTDKLSNIPLMTLTGINSSNLDTRLTLTRSAIHYGQNVRLILCLWIEAGLCEI